MAKQRLFQPEAVGQVQTPIVDTTVAPQKPGETSISRLVDALGAAAPGVEAVAKAGIRTKAEAEAKQASNIAKEIRSTDLPEDTTVVERREAWRKATNENPVLMGLNPHAQALVRKENARVLGRSMEPDIVDLVRTVGGSQGSIKDGEQGFRSITEAINRMREERLKELDLDEDELTAFNSEFAQMEQNYTAQYNNAVAAARKNKAMELVQLKIGDVVSDGLDELDTTSFSEGTMSSLIGQRISDVATSFRNAGTLLQSDQNPTVLRSVSDILIQSHIDRDDDAILNMTKDDLLTNINLKIGDKDTDVFNLKDHKNGTWANDLINKLEQISAEKKRNRLAGIERIQQRITDHFNAALFDAYNNTEVGSHEQLMQISELQKQANSPEVQKVMPVTWPATLEKMRNTMRALAEKAPSQAFNDGIYSDKFMTEINPKLQSEPDWIPTNEDIYAEGLTLAERNHLLEERESRSNQVASQFTPTINDYKSSMANFRQGIGLKDAGTLITAGQLANQLQGKALSQHEKKAIQDADILGFRLIATIQDPTTNPQEKADAAQELANLKARVNEQLFTDTSASLDEIKKASEIKTLLAPGEAEQLMRLNVDDRKKVLLERGSVENLERLFPGLDSGAYTFANEVWEEDVVNDPRMSIPNARSFNEVAAFGDVLAKFKIRFNPPEATQADAIENQFIAQLGNNAQMTFAVNKVINNFEVASSMAKREPMYLPDGSYNYNSLMNSKQSLGSVIDKKHTALTTTTTQNFDDNKMRVVGSASKRFFGEMLNDTIALAQKNDQHDVGRSLAQDRLGWQELTNLLGPSVLDQPLQQSSTIVNFMPPNSRSFGSNTQLYRMITEMELWDLPGLNLSRSGGSIRLDSQSVAEVLAAVTNKVGTKVKRVFKNDSARLDKDIENARQAQETIEAAVRTPKDTKQLKSELRDAGNQ